MATKGQSEKMRKMKDTVSGASETVFETMWEAPIAFSGSAVGSVRLSRYENAKEKREGMSVSLRRSQMTSGGGSQLKSVSCGSDPSVLRQIAAGFNEAADRIEKGGTVPVEEEPAAA